MCRNEQVKIGLYVCHIACVLPRLASGVAQTRLGAALLPQWNTFSFSNPIWTFIFPCVLVKCFCQSTAKLASGRSPYSSIFIYFFSNWSLRHAAPWHRCSIFFVGGIWCLVKSKAHRQICWPTVSHFVSEKPLLICTIPHIPHGSAYML